MLIKIKNKGELIIDDFIFKCCIGKNGTKQNKIEGDKSTPKGTFGIGPVYYRSDRIKKPNTLIKTKTNPNKKYHAPSKPLNSPHTPIPNRMKANSMPKDRSENTLIYSPLFKFSCIFLSLTINTNIFF